MIGVRCLRLPLIVFVDRRKRRGRGRWGLRGRWSLLGREPVAAEREHRDAYESQADQHGGVQGGIHKVS